MIFLLGIALFRKCHTFVPWRIFWGQWVGKRHCLYLSGCRFGLRYEANWRSSKRILVFLVFRVNKPNLQVANLLGNIVNLRLSFWRFLADG